MNKKELNNGAVVVTRNNLTYIKIDNTLLNLKSFGGWINLIDYRDDLTSICDKKFDIIKVYNDVVNEFGACTNAIRKWNDNNKPTWERKEILDDVEKKYLSAVIKPFRNRVINILKRGYYSSDEQYLIIRLKKEQANDNIVLPDFKANTMYKGMEVDKAYTLEELEL